MSLLDWILAVGGLLFIALVGLFAWVLSATAKLGDEIQQMQRLAELGQRPVYRPVSDRHIRDFTESE